MPRTTLVLLMLYACSPSPVNPTNDAEATPNCALACSKMRAMHCPLGQPTAKGASCESVCLNVQQQNMGAGFDATCVANASSCAAADVCR